MLSSANRGATFAPWLVIRSRPVRHRVPGTCMVRLVRRLPRACMVRLVRRLPRACMVRAALLAMAGIGACHRPPDARGLLPRGAGAPDGVHFRAVVVAQRADCTGNLGHLAFLERAGVASAVLQRHLLVAGSAADTLGLRALMPRALQRATIDLLDDAQRTLLATLGHRATPVIALFDGRDRLLILSATPDDPLQRTVFVRAASRLVTNNPAP